MQSVRQQQPVLVPFCWLSQAEESKLVAFESSTLASVQSMLRLHLTCEDTEMEIQLQVLVLDEVHRACVQFSFPKGVAGDRQSGVGRGA